MKKAKGKASTALAKNPATVVHGLEVTAGRRRSRRAFGGAVVLAAAAACSVLDLPEPGGDLGLFALGVGLAALLLRSRPRLLGILTLPTIVAVIYPRFRLDLATGLFAAAEAAAIAGVIWYAAWRFARQRVADEKSMSALEATIDELRAISIRDPLTGLYNRRFAYEAGRGYSAQSRRYGNDLHVLMLDIDHFKHVNDDFGHAAGDEALKGLAEILLNIVRQSDVAARIGGEEFLILLPQTGAEAAYNIANRIRDSVAAATFKSVPRKVTVSLGVAGLREGEPFEDAVERADACLYQSKHSGRNRVTVG